MGRTRIKTRKPAASKAIPISKQDEPSISALYFKAQSLVTQCDYDLAQKFAQRIVDRDPSHVDARELLGIIQLEKGDLEDAQQTFRFLLPPAPTAPNPPPASAHLYLAQLSDDPHVALKHYEAAAASLLAQLKGKERADLSNDPSQETEQDVRRNIVRVLVAMVEIWMAPTYVLCFDPKAEETCESLLKSAFDTDPENVEAWICLSSFRLSQQKEDDAKQAAMKAWAMWKDEEDESKIPPIPSRIDLTKRFLELHEYAHALQILQTIMASDDQEVEAWYLEGWCFYLMSEEAKETGKNIEDLSWEELARDARDCLETCKMLHTSVDHADDRMLEHTVELIGQIDALGIKPSPDDEEETGEDADGWEDESDAEDVDMN